MQASYGAPPYNQPPNFPPGTAGAFPTSNTPPFVPGQGYGPPPGQAPFSGVPIAFPGSSLPAPPGMPPRPAFLPTGNGLPARPSFNAPAVNQQQLQQMHHGQLPGLPLNTGNGELHTQPGASQADLSTSLAIDELIAHATKEASKVEATSAPVPEKEKKSKKEKLSRMVYTDNEVSPEEKWAKLPRYALVPSNGAATATV